MKTAVERISKREGTSINQFIATAVVEKLAVMDAEEFFKVRQSRADLKKFDAIMKRKSRQSPRAGDEA